MADVATASFDEFLVSSEFLSNPYPALHQLLEQDPVHWSNSIGGWIVTRYDDVAPTFRNVTFYSNEERLAGVVEYLPTESRAKFKTFEDYFRAKSLLHSDPPDHTRLRALITKVFNATRVEAMRTRIQTIVNDLLDSTQSAGRMEVIKDLATPLPVKVIGGILGVPVSDQPHVKEWADGLLAFQGVNKPGEAILERSQNAVVGIRDYMGRLIEEKRRNPADDVLSYLLAVESEGEKLSTQELVYTCITLLVAGHETTTSLIGNGLYTILAHPDQWRMLQSNPSLLTSAIEEMLRFESPVARQPRLLKQDTELGGKQLRKGQMVFQMLNAANRDPAYFTDPDQFDIQREKNRHVAFGMGIHFCVGAMLARTEGQIVFRTILQRLPRIELIDDAPDWDLDKPNSRMLRTLPVKF
jgi:cytochrome P450